ncbi:S-adenosyl-L-methionine-dependent methyltransferase [Pluteus cervinus]|uniref:S-adenosyl-L-methionine-dependent methyltransferase n=1 Tax=Pluteus cervinus TaxID=181527 RepID=A0ACD3ASK6_9AGAR|nr:S-adenosyl-L-methionine-dependent methyltransferase [Pluteus cervinus]
MPPRKRPSAFDVSFPEESNLTGSASSRAQAGSAASSVSAAAPASSNTARGSSASAGGSRPNSRYSTPQSEASSSTSSSLKRPREDDHPQQQYQRAKRVQRPAVAYYSSVQKASLEAEVIEGETEDVLDGDDKPIRLLSEFAFFDPRHKSEFITLDSIEDDDGMDREFEGAGYILPYINDEDEGQEDGIEFAQQYVRLGAILRYSVDYTKESEPFYIETQYAWYILQRPSAAYENYYAFFYRPRRIAQMIISKALKDDKLSYSVFVKDFTSQVDMFGRTYKTDDIYNAIEEIQDALDECNNPLLRAHRIIRYIFEGLPQRPQTPKLRTQHRRPPPRNVTRNLDDWVLKPENQNPTCVTPLIALLAQGFVQEQLQVIGPRPPPVLRRTEEAQLDVAYHQLCGYVEQANKPDKYVNYRREDRLRAGSSYVKSIEVDGVQYFVGDYIIVRRGPVGKGPPPVFPETVEEVPKSGTVADLFWFARIIWINYEDETTHVQWLEHGTTIMFEELAHPQELFLDELCETFSLKLIVAKVTVHCKPQDHSKIPMGEYFYRFIHDIPLSAFKSLNTHAVEVVSMNHPPENCAVCLVAAEASHDSVPLSLKDNNGNLDGISYMSTKYHIDDFVLYHAEKGPANIGQIVDVVAPSGDRAMVKVRCVGRIGYLSHILPDNTVRDERHLYLTNQVESIQVKELVTLCYVVPKVAAGDQLKGWLSSSPFNFYATYKFPNLTPTSWNQKEELNIYGLHVCGPCLQKQIDMGKSLQKFQKTKHLHVLDVFGGVGAFGFGLKEGSGCLDVTHAIEIGPSAARTFLKNSPNTKIINQCANLVLQYAIKQHEGHSAGDLYQLFNDKEKIPAPPKPGEIDVITAGFPCQTHSGLNMYKVADDIKSNLILNALSWVDFLHPKYVYFENVPGFLQYNLNAYQAGLHRLEGGIEKGGLKMLVRAMTEMGYQCRYGLLQAGQYGAPQTRIRFFLVAALDGYPLPELPQPTHDFPLLYPGLKIKLPSKVEIEPIRTMTGTAPHAMVTVEDAIGDLPKFDWKHPFPRQLTQVTINQNKQRAVYVPAFACNTKEPYCGFTGAPEYEHRPITSFQAHVRKVATTDLQQFTKCVVPKKVARVVVVPITPDADYRDLKPEHWEWQFSNPLSAVAKANYKPGKLYSRVPNKGFFSTTVTNVDPTAKQSRVLHPLCKRMVTVRELARSQGFPDSFVFESMSNSVVIMHRQIGNAVAWPVGMALGRELLTSLHTKWKIDQVILKEKVKNAIVIEDSD